MEKNIEVSLLLDFYGELLKPGVRQTIDLYYNDDLSLAEVADRCGITRQGVRDSVKRGEAQLFDFEKKLGLMRRLWGQLSPDRSLLRPSLPKWPGLRMRSRKNHRTNTPPGLPRK